MKEYLTGTRWGERKRRGKEQTHTNTLAQSGQTLKGQEERKRRPTDTEQDQREGGKTEAPEPTWHSENLRLPRHAQDPTYLGREERMK